MNGRGATSRHVANAGRGEQRRQATAPRGPESDSAALTLIRADKQGGLFGKGLPLIRAAFYALLLLIITLSVFYRVTEWQPRGFVCDTLARY